MGTREKALRLNLESPAYGSFAEIGAGQEVARWFFAVGGAAGTVAKTISAYDMSVSDALYGPAQRDVSRQRLEAMLKQEFAQLIESGARVEPRRCQRGSSRSPTRWPREAVTVRKAEATAGWACGSRHRREQEPSQVIVHAYLLDSSGGARAGECWACSAST